LSRRVPCPIPVPFLTEEQAATYLGISASTLQKFRVSGKGPIYRDHGRVVYLKDELDAWSASRSRRSTSDATPLSTEEASHAR